MAKRTRLAVFDIDGTIFRSSLIIEVFNALIAAGIFPRKASKQVETSYLKWLNRKGHYNDYLMKLVHTFYLYIPGKRVDRVNAVIDRVIAWQKDRVYRYTRDLIHTFKKRGYFLIAISNSPSAMVGLFAKAQHFDAAIGRTWEIKNGKYTGGILYNGAPFPINSHLDKVEILRDYLLHADIKAEMKDSIAVGDSEGDIPLLAAVGHPIAFNPSLELAEFARRRKWRIVVERKDVIYDIRETTFIPHHEHQRVRVGYGNEKKKRA